MAGRDTVSTKVATPRAAQTLSAVKVTAKEDLARKAYHIDGEEIAKSDRPLFTGVDVIEKLRPDMIWGLGGSPTPHGNGRVCPRLSNVFVNGRRIGLDRRDVSDFAQIVSRARVPNVGAVLYGALLLNGAQVNMAQRALATSSQMLTDKVVGLPAAVLTTIKPEHIAEITYNDCFEESAKVNAGANAVFIVLKPGIGYSRENGSYVMDTDTPSTLAPDATSLLSAAPFPTYRIRILGVFDDDTGEMVEGAEVVEVLTGTKALTSLTGTVSLAFLPEGNSDVRVLKPGYRPLALRVAISPQDTVPITLTLKRER